MTDREKVIKGLEICAVGTNSCTPCPFKDNCKGTSNAAMAMAIKLLKAQEAQGWISVKDRLPENQNPVVVFVPPHVDKDKGTFLGYVGMAYFTRLGEGFWCGTDGNLYGAIGMIYTPTHWMPLPEEPGEEE